MPNRIFLLFAAILMALSVQISFAQGSARVLINYPELADSGGDQAPTLGLYFNLLDGDGHPLTNAAPRSATIILDDGNRYNASITRPDTPFFIVLALDASGSMGGVSTAMQSAAVNLVQNAPAEVSFRVIRFNDAIDESLMSGFTTDRSATINAIAEVNAVPNAGTCLFDVAYRSVQILSNAPAGRRALILFTDGVDQVLSGERCSQHSSEDVISAANQPNARVPIHTIGLRGGQPVDEVGLQALSQSTGGVSVVGNQAQLGELFSIVANSVQAQWLASSPIYPQQGVRSATLIVSLANNLLVQPDAVIFNAPRAVAVPVNLPAAEQSASNITTSPSPGQIRIDSVQADADGQNIAARVTVDPSMPAAEYRFNLVNARTNLLIGEYPFVAPLPNPVMIPAGNLPNGDYVLSISAFAADGRFIAHSDDQRFTIAFPTATPSPTNTPEPPVVILESIAYDADQDLVSLHVSYAATASVGSVRVELFNRQTNLLVGTYTFSPEAVLQVGADGLPGGNYTVVLAAQDNTGQVLSQVTKDFSFTPSTPTPRASVGMINSVSFDAQTGEIVVNLSLPPDNSIANLRANLIDNRSGLQVGTFSFTSQPELRMNARNVASGDYRLEIVAEDVTGQTLNRESYTFAVPTATPTMTFTPTATVTATETPVAAIIIIDAAELNDDRTEVLLHVLVENPQLITTYELSVFDENTGLRVTNFGVAPVNNEVRLPLDDIANGRYRIELVGHDSAQRTVAQVSRVIVIDLPAATPTFTPTAIPEGIAADSPSGPDSRLIPLIVIGVISLVLVGILILIVRRSRKPKATGDSGFAEGLTGIFEAAAAPVAYTPVEPSDDPYSTSAQPIQDPGLTSAVPIMKPPASKLTVRDSRDQDQVGQVFPISKTPFVIGRFDPSTGKGCDLNFDKDNNVSRRHAEIRYANGEFLITDIGSNHGTEVDGMTIAQHAPVPLNNGSTIVLGKTTVLGFETEYDADQTRLKN